MGGLMRTINLLFLLIILCLLSACNMAGFNIKPTSTPVILGDCFLEFHIGAWQDINGNGLWDGSEPPLERVKFVLNGTFAELMGYPYLSKADGWVTLETWSPGGCPNRDFTIIAEPPVSYEPTTDKSITISISTGRSPFEAKFGFRALID
jgi:hypothetical protein